MACPLSAGKSYTPRIIAKTPSVIVPTPIVYVIGGLYGNTLALDAIDELVSMEYDETTRIFNGDFNFFNTSSSIFEEVNDRLRFCESTICLSGNIENALSDHANYTGCGCDYPSYVSNHVVKNADAIVSQLHTVAREHEDILGWLKSLRTFLTVELTTGGRVAVVHGDANSQSGWQFSVETMEPTDNELRAKLNVGATADIQATKDIENILEEANVFGFCSSHTCLAFAQSYANGVIFNNGAAGIPVSFFSSSACGWLVVVFVFVQSIINI